MEQYFLSTNLKSDGDESQSVHKFILILARQIDLNEILATSSFLVLSKVCTSSINDRFNIPFEGN